MATASPLDTLHRLIAEASELPKAQPYQPSAEPMLELAAALKGRAPAPATAPAPETVPGPSSEGDATDAIVGREVLKLVARQPLSAAARAEAVRRLSVALQNPTSDNVRSVLAVLVSDRVDV